MKYRWLDTEKPVRCVGRASRFRGQEGRLLIVGRNCLVDFGGERAVCPHGTLRAVTG